VPGVATEERCSYRRFEISDLRAEGRLRCVQPLCRAGEAQVLGYSNKIPQVPFVHLNSPAVPQRAGDPMRSYCTGQVQVLIVYYKRNYYKHEVAFKRNI